MSKGQDTQDVFKGLRTFQYGETENTSMEIMKRELGKKAWAARQSHA